MTNTEKLTQRIIELEAALDQCLEWAEMVSGSSDFEESDTLQYCLWVLTQGTEGHE